MTGEVLLDLVGHNHPADPVVHYQGRLGGSALNTALLLRQLDLSVAFIGNIGEGSVGRWALTQLDLKGIDTRYLQALPVASPLSLAEIDDSGNAQYAFYRMWADLPFQPDLEAMGAATWFHFGSLSAFLPRNVSGVTGLLKAARRQGSTVSFDPNLRARLPDGYMNQLGAYLPYIDVIKCSLEDARYWFPNCTEEQALQALEAWGVPLVIVTLGERGALASWRGRKVRVPARTVRLVDTIGAGDTFTAGLVYGLYWLGFHRASRLKEGDGTALLRLVLGAADLAATVCEREGAGLEDQQLAVWRTRHWTNGGESQDE